MDIKSAWIYCSIDAPEDTHGILKGQADNEMRSVRVGRAYKIPKPCVIEYLLGEEMCHIKIG